MKNIIESVIPLQICEMIMEKYYSKIIDKVDFDHITHDVDFLKKTDKHMALYGDHGLHHVVNVAEQIPLILKSVFGIYIPKRSGKRINFMEKFGILLGFIHDIGMSDVSMFGRVMHGEFAAQEVFQPNFEPIFTALWEDNAGNIPWTLLNMYHNGLLNQSPELIFREMLSLSICHRKTLVPVDILNDKYKLQKKMKYYISNTLKYQYYNNHVEKAAKAIKEAETKGIKDISDLVKKLQEAKDVLEKAPKHEISPEVINANLSNFYKDFENEAFSWLSTSNKKSLELIDDIVDTLRIIRCSDALRQRGTDLKTSAQFQIFASRFTAKAIYALTDKNGHMYFLEIDNEIGNGEANISSCFFTKEGDLRFEFAHGFFHSDEAIERGANCLAKLIAQLDYDISDTFLRNSNNSFVPLKRPEILLEKTDDYPEFTQLLLQKLIAIDLEYAKTVKIVPSLKNIPLIEYLRYINADEVALDDDQKKILLKKVAATGYKTNNIDIKKAFSHARIASIAEKEIIFEAKTQASFVYFPFSEGLEGFPTGSYSSFKVTPYTPLGSTGVIRGDVRNATIVSQNSLQLLIVPKDDYLDYWYATYSKDEFIQMINDGVI